VPAFEVHARRRFPRVLPGARLRPRLSQELQFGKYGRVTVMPVIFVDTGQHFPETLDYRDRLCETLGLTNGISSTPRTETVA